MSRNNSLQMDQLTDSAYYILLALLSPKHGYSIMKYIEELTDGEVKIGPATLYTLVKKMLDAGLIVMDEDEDPRRKTYRLTVKGKSVVTLEIERRFRMAQHGKLALQTEEEG
ncbi:PadR family transcriptional regulator [Paenibacillus filicis]|uniref:PadR family transcriptional regulator n=1 Tax=Paenibacillus filicis TaxID=669464 RepID=A0ABU9DCJ0_9BACL